MAPVGQQACIHYYPGRCPGLGVSALSGRAASGAFGASALYLSLRPVTVGSGRIAAMDLDSIEHNLDEVVDGALIACVGTEGSTVGDDHAAG